MHYVKSRNEYNWSNCKLVIGKTLSDIEAFSYNWWQFVKVEIVGGRGIVIFNAYKYSVSTAAHQRKVLNQLYRLNIVPDVVVYCPSGLQNDDWQQQHVAVINDRIAELRAYIAKNGIRHINREKAQLKVEKLQHDLELFTLKMSEGSRNNIALVAAS
jgi:hypothetical protein